MKTAVAVSAWLAAVSMAWAEVPECHSTSPDQMYGVNFAAQIYGDAWDSILSGADPCPSGKFSFDVARNALTAGGPWCIDINHVEYAPIVGPAVIWTNTPKDDHVIGIPGCPDLRDASLDVEVEFNYERSDTGACAGEFDISDTGRLLFWFQTELPSLAYSKQYAAIRHGNASRIVNYVFTGEKANLWNRTLPSTLKSKIKLSNNLKDWHCLGRNQSAPTNPYTCAMSQDEFMQALSSVNVDMGLLVLLPDRGDWLNDNAPERTLSLCSSHIAIRKFALQRKAS